MAVRFFLPGDDITSIVPAAGGFSGAAVFRVTTVSGEYALRRWPKAVAGSRIAELHRFLRHLHQFGIPVAVPLISQQTLQSVQFLSGEAWQLEPWLSGRPIDPSLSTGSLQAVMETLSRLHLAASQYACTSAGAVWFSRSNAPCSALAERFQMLKTWTLQKIQQRRSELTTAPEDFQQMGSTLLEQLPRYLPRLLSELSEWNARQVSVALHPCWRDLWSEHVLLGESGEVNGFIDPAAARTEHVATDLSRLLGSLFQSDWNQWETALDFYSHVRPLNHHERTLVRVLDRSSVVLSGLHWLDQQGAAMISPQAMPSVTKRLRSFVQRLETL